MLFCDGRVGLVWVGIWDLVLLGVLYGLVLFASRFVVYAWVSCFVVG